eukprot:360686-Chlamydomonas_euryale.AAC.4
MPGRACCTNTQVYAMRLVCLYRAPAVFMPNACIFACVQCEACACMEHLLRACQTHACAHAYNAARALAWSTCCMSTSVRAACAYVGGK